MPVYFYRLFVPVAFVSCRYPIGALKTGMQASSHFLGSGVFGGSAPLGVSVSALAHPLSGGAVTPQLRGEQLSA
jgi:hypothetical protein